MIVYQELGEGQKKAVKWFFVIGSLVLAALFIALLFLYSVRALRELDLYGGREKFSITASGDGSVFVIPDIATLSLTVKTVDPSLKEATDSNNDKSNAVASFLKSRGVDEKDIKTSYFNIYPQYQYDDYVCREGYCPPRGAPRIVSYEVTNSIQVKVRNRDKIGEILSGAVSAGANEVSGPSFSVDDETKSKRDARALAIEKAEANAKELAEKLGVKLIRKVGFSESGGAYPLSYQALGKGGGVADAVGSAPSIEPGQNEIEVNVSVTYEVE